MTGLYSKINITDVDSHKRVEHLYRCMLVFNQGLLNWMRAFLPPSIFGLSCCFIIVMFVTIRDTELPTFIYCSFPIMGGFFMGIIFWVSYDVMMTKRAFEEVSANLQSSAYMYYQRELDPQDRKVCLKRAKALRRASFPVGNFGEISFELPVMVWEESVEQLLVLLSF